MQTTISILGTKCIEISCKQCSAVMVICCGRNKMVNGSPVVKVKVMVFSPVVRKKGLESGNSTARYLHLSHHKKMRPPLERNSSEKIQVGFLCEEWKATSHNKT